MKASKDVLSGKIFEFVFNNWSQLNLEFKYINIIFDSTFNKDIISQFLN